MDDMPYRRRIFVFHNPGIQVAWNSLENKINYVSQSFLDITVDNLYN